MDLGFIQSIFFFFGVLSLVYGVSFSFYPSQKDRQAIAHWSQGSFIWGCSILLTIFRKELPLLLSYYAANALAFLAYVELNRALKALIGADFYRAPKRWLDVLMLLAYMGTLYSIGFWTPDGISALAKTGFVSALVFLVSLLGATYCFQIARVHHLAMARYFGYFHLIFAGLWLMRVSSAIAFQTPSAFDPSHLNTAIWMSMFIMAVIKYIVFPMLLQQKAENDRQAQLRNSLVRANKTIASGALSASIAHELNQPLASIRLNGQLLRHTLLNQVTPREEVKAIIDDILSENARAAKIISSLRAIFSHNASEQHEIYLTPLIQKTVALLSKEIHKHKILVEMQLDDKLQLTIPEDELHQVLINLLLNSIQALQAPSVTKRTIVISSKRLGPQAQICISDTGTGITPEFEPNLFEILSTSKDSGMGVGLWLCKYIVERHGGGIAYTSVHGGGASFTITLPLVAGDAVGSVAEG